MKYEKLNHEPEVNLLHDFISKNEIHKLKMAVKVLFSKIMEFYCYVICKILKNKTLPS